MQIVIVVMHALFLSTLSLRRATSSGMSFSVVRYISIHALLAESDRQSTQKAMNMPNFYPRSPCGERLNAHLYYHSRGLFLSTLSLRRATLANARNSPSNQISIHALLAESDISCSLRYWSRANISIHALLAESDSHPTHGD